MISRRLIYFSSFFFLLLILVLFILSLYLWNISPSIGSIGCIISVKTALGQPQPLILRPGRAYGNEAFYYPQIRSGELIFKANDELTLDCPGGSLQSNGKSLQKQNITVVCSAGKIIPISEEFTEQPFKNLTCSVPPVHNAVETNKSCLGSKSYKSIEIGFNVSDGRFLNHISVCYDPNNQTTLYTQYNLTASISRNQSIKLPNNFIQGSFYNIGNYKLKDLYRKNEQRVNLNKLLGLVSNDYKYISNDVYLSHGHLVAKADFVYGAQQNATYYYINVAPQWQPFNGENWNCLEIAVRDYASKKNLDLIVYTGTHGVTTLPQEKTGDDVKLYLYADGKGGLGIPVPQVFWKVVYEPNTKAGIAFVGVNNPYRKDIEEDTICKDICAQISWNLLWDKSNITKGYSYCCDVNELRKNVTNVPTELVVLELLK